MKYLPLIIANIRRKRMRSLLTLVSFSVALFLFGLLVTIYDSFNQGIDVAGADRLIVLNKTSLIVPLPISYRDRINQIDGVRAVTFASWFGGIYQDKRNFFPQFAIESETWRAMYPEFIVPEKQWRDYIADRQGCIVGTKLVELYGFKIGDRVPLQATIYQNTWEFNVRGIYTGARKNEDTSQFWFHNEYLDERSPFEKGYVGWYVVKVDHPDNALMVASAIDERFANSPFETRTDTEKAFAAGFVKQFGNIKLIMLSVGSVVFFTLMLITGSNMALSIRERTAELAVMKTLGFSPMLIMFLVLIESIFYALCGGLVGLGLVKLFTLTGGPAGAMLPVFYFGFDRMTLGIAASVLTGIFAGIVPAYGAMRLNIVDALRRV